LELCGSRLRRFELIVEDFRYITLKGTDVYMKREKFVFSKEKRNAHLTKRDQVYQKETKYIKKRPGISKRDQVYQKRRVCKYKVNTANPTWGDIFECCFKAQSSNLERLFSLKRGKRDVRALSFELSIPNRYGMHI